MKQQCCPNVPNRRIMRSVHERSREVAREIANTTQYKQSRRDRKKVEMLFAHLKRILKLDRLRPRGLTGAHDESLLAATAQNLRRMAKRLHASPRVDQTREHRESSDHGRLRASTTQRAWRTGKRAHGSRRNFKSWTPVKPLQPAPVLA